MKKKTQEELSKEIFSQTNNSKNIAVLISEPDQDSVGSGLALKEILKVLNKESDLYSSFSVDKFHYLPNIKQYTVQDIANIKLKGYDTIFVLDASQLYRLVDVKMYPNGITLPKKSTVINIDHHNDNPGFGSINYIGSQKISSTAEALYVIFNDKVSFSPSIATNLLAGLIEDTGCFRHAFTSQTLRIVADLIDKKGDYNMLVNQIYYSNSKRIVRANVKCLSNLSFKKAGKYSYAYSIVKPKDFGIEVPRRSDIRILQETMKSISGIDFSMRITPLAKNITDISLRSRDVKVASIAEHFKGGGHDRAAGTTVRMDVKTFLRELNNFLRKTNLSRETRL